jgi:hypothetical protein
VLGFAMRILRFQMDNTKATRAVPPSEKVTDASAVTFIAKSKDWRKASSYYSRDRFGSEPGGVFARKNVMFYAECAALAPIAAIEHLEPSANCANCAGISRRSIAVQLRTPLPPARDGAVGVPFVQVLPDFTLVASIYIGDALLRMLPYINGLTHFDMETLSFGTDVAPRGTRSRRLRARPPINVPLPAPSATIVNSNPRSGTLRHVRHQSVYDPVETLFMIVWNTQ